MEKTKYAVALCEGQDKKTAGLSIVKTNKDKFTLLLLTSGDQAHQLGVFLDQLINNPNNIDIEFKKESNLEVI